MHLELSKFTEIVKSTPLVAIDLFIVKNKKLLIGKRKNPPGMNSYFVPGGRIKKNEKIKQAFRRILKSETNLEIRNKAYEPVFIGIDEHFYEDNFLKNKNFSTHYVVLLYLIEFSELEEINSNLNLENQHHNLKWIDNNSESKILDNMNKYMKGYLNREIIKNFFS